MLELERFLNQQSYRGHRTILIVDEAQSLSPSALEELRQLANMQRKDQLLLQIFLVGQEKLLDLIRAPGMEQLQQRLVAASVLEPLDLDETVDYIEHRLSLVAWRGDPAINEEALRLIYKYSGGIPRRINMICNRLFLYGGMQQKHELLGEDTRTVIEELHQEFLLPAEPPGEGGDGQQKDVERSADGAKTPVRSLPRGERTAGTAPKPSGQRSSPVQRSQRRAKKTPPRSQSRPVETTRPDREVREPLPPRRAKNRPGRAATGFNRQPVGKAGEPAARRVSAAEPDSRQRKGKHLRVTVAALFLLAGSLFAVIIATDTKLDELLKVVGLGESRDTFKTLLKTGVHKAITVFPGSEEAVTLESQSGQPEQPEPAEAEVVPDESEQDQARATDTTPIASTPVTPAAEVEKPTDTATSTVTTSVTVNAEKDSAIRPETTDTEKPDDGVETVSTPTPTAVKTVTNNDDAEPTDDNKANAAAIDAEYGKLRQVAGERFSQRRTQVGSETVKVVPSPKKPSLPIVVDRTSVTNVSVPKVSMPKSSAPKSSTPKVSVPKATAPKASTPRVSVPKVSAPKASQPKITVAAATAAAKPERSTKKGALSQNKIRSALLEGQWTSQGKPASLLPSEITFCNSQGEDRIGCWSVAQNINTKYGPALYKVETTLKGFSDGSFKLSYRTLVKLVDAGASAGAKEKAASSKDGWQVTEHFMQCQLTQPDT
ncbi:MAG: AAA family ATPase, partial [Pseudomonadota bacterium]|nr:AAA family ATPase [Pseudomonadota bacterium]